MKIFSQFFGWIGTAFILTAYLLISNNYVAGNNAYYQAMNLVGAIGVGINVYYRRAWPAVILQVVWGLIALITLIRMWM